MIEKQEADTFPPPLKKLKRANIYETMIFIHGQQAVQDSDSLRRGNK